MAIDLDSVLKQYTDKSDFGFTAQSEEEFSKNKLTIEDLQVRIQKIEELILPLLANLHADAENKPHIYWPNRGPELEKKIKEFLELTRAK